MTAPVRIAAVVYACFAVAMVLWLGLHSHSSPAEMNPDQDVYKAMAAHPFSADADARQAPWCWRIGEPSLVWATGLDPDKGFHAITIVSVALVPAVTMLLLRSLGVSTVTTVFLGGVAMMMPPIVGYASWAYAMTDAFGVLLVTIAVWAAVTKRLLLFGIVIVLLAATKETWVLAGAFALLRTRARDPSHLRSVAAAVALAAAVAVGIRLAIVPSNQYAMLATVAHLYLPLSATELLRRALLATAGTWNVLTPVLALSLRRMYRRAEGLAFAVPILLAMVQPLLATQTQRPVAAAYPFVLSLCALEIDGWRPRTRLLVGLALFAAQVPWLLDYAGVADLRLRELHIGLVVAAVVALTRTSDN